MQSILTIYNKPTQEKNPFPLSRLASSAPNMVYANEMTICIDIIR